MKVLYIGSERSEAQTIASALRGVDEGVSVLWAAQLENAANWLGESRGLDVLVMEAPIDGASCLVVLKQLRRLALPPVVVFIVPDGIAPTLDSLHPGAHYVRRNQFLSRDLPIVVTRAIEREARADLERKLAQADKQLAEQQAKYDIGMARAEANWEMVDEQLRDAARQVEQARQDQELAGDEVERLSRRESELSSQLSDAAAAHIALERQLAELHSAVTAANERTEQERVTAASRIDDLQRQFETRIAHAIDERRSIEAQLAHAIRAREDAEQRHAAATRDVAELKAREAALNDQLAELTSSRTELEGKLTATEAAFEDAVTRATRERLTASKKAAEREAELDSQIRRERDARVTLEQTLRDTTTALDRARRDHDSAISDIERLTQREADLAFQLTDVQTAREALERELAGATSSLRRATARESDLAEQIEQERATRARLEQTIADTDAALSEARAQHHTAAGEIALLTSREADLGAQLADVETAREALERELADAATAIRSAAARQSELGDQIQHERATRVALEQTIADADAAHRAAQQRHEVALAAAAAELAAREAELTEQLEQERATRTTLEHRLADADAALERLRQDHKATTADVKRAKRREADLASQLADVHSSRDTLERQLADATRAVESAGVREADLLARLEEERTTRIALEQAIADANAAHLTAQQQHEAALSAAAKELATREAELTSQLADATGALDAAAAREASLTEQLGQERAIRTLLEDRLASTDVALERVRDEYQSAIADVDRLQLRETDLSSALADEQAARATLERQLADACIAIREATERETALDEQLQVSTSEVDRLSEREADLTSQLADAQAVREAIEQTLADARARFVEQRQKLEIQLAQTQLEHESHAGELEARNRALTVERDAAQQSLASLQDRTRQLQESLAASVDAFEVSRSESLRLFDHAGVAMFRCTRDGALTDVNRALTTLIGRRTYELASVDFAAAVFEAPQALSWLIERCISTRAKESIETTWRRQDGSRLFMRLSARSLASGMVEVIAEDLTRLRVLEERLGQAHRMEAVGRLASEVATTCSNLLATIREQGRDWVSQFPTHSDARTRGEELFDDVGRAVAFLQELAACGEEQARTPMLVDLNTLVRDLEPVLKNVVGGEVEVALRDTSTPLNVDVNTERIERLLVNLASYGRGRMPAGGRLRIELGTSVVDRHFSAKHPNVRLGLHALITVTESRGTERDASQSRSHRRSASRPGVDFGTLQELVSDCGGHLWMKVHPLGEMVAKIRLPLFSPQEQRAPRALTSRGSRERQAARWFQS
jgi:PAS domain S-box-containing protein